MIATKSNTPTTMIEFNNKQSLNAFSPIEETPSGIVGDPRLEQDRNAPFEIEVTLFEI